MANEGEAASRRGIDAVDAELVAWISSVVAPVPVSLGPPPPHATDSGVSAYLSALAPRPPSAGRNGTTVEYGLRYLISTWAPTPEEAHALLSDLLFAATGRKDMEVDVTPPPVELWSGLGVPVQPSFVLRVPLRQERRQPAAPPVLHPLQVEMAKTVQLRGVVVGNDDRPVAGAHVRLLPTDRIAWTDDQGCFALGAVTVVEGPCRIEVVARGRQFTVLSEAAEPEAPLVVRVDLLREEPCR